jgi:DNA-binding transcriptional regulator LsrR (DeoR family)
MPIEPGLGRLLYKIAQAYYEEGLTQKEIGERLGLSRIKISRLLQQARDLQVVQITLNPPDPIHSRLERDLEEKYRLDEAIVVTPDSYESDAIKRALGPAAAECLLRNLEKTDSVAVTWGSTVAAVVNALPVESWSDVHVVQCLGGVAGLDSPANTIDVTRRMAEKLGARPLILPAPGLVASKELRDALIQETTIGEVLASAARCDVAIVGIGVPTLDGILGEQNVLDEPEVARLRNNGAVGDICLRFYDADGLPVEDELNDRIIGVTLEQIRGIRRVIGVAGGEYKADAIRVALTGGLVNVLVTDDLVARRLLDR